MKTSLKSLAVLATLAVALTSVQADQITLSQNSSYSVGNGGAFVAKIKNGDITNADYSGVAKIGADSFATFCIEHNEYFAPGGTYNYVVNTGSVNGGAGGQTVARPNYDGISNATAFLYAQFAQGTLAGVADFTYDLTATGYGYLQNAIWNLEDEGIAENKLAKWAKDNVANWNDDSNGSYGVFALNLQYTDRYGRDAGRAQDQLYYHNVPEQGLTVALLGLALLGLAGVRRMTGSK